MPIERISVPLLFKLPHARSAVLFRCTEKTELVLNSSIGRNRCTRSHTGCCSHKLLGQQLEFKKDCCILYTCPTCYEHYMKVARRYKHDKVNPGTQKPSIKQISRAVTREFSSNCNILQQPHSAPIIANRPLKSPWRPHCTPAPHSVSCPPAR